ncbi:MAG: Nudix family hydrolase [Gammaproteobacteria bacterium]
MPSRSNVPIVSTVTAEVGVAAGILQRDDGSYILAERPAGKLLGGYLEFPGGKLEPGETPEAALAREIKEELGVAVRRAEPLVQFEHAYPDYRVRAYLFRVMDWAGEVRGREGQRLIYAEPGTLRELPLLPANRPILAALELPAALMVTPEPEPDDSEDFIRRFKHAIENDTVGGAILRLKISSGRSADWFLREVATSARRSGDPHRGRAAAEELRGGSRRGPSLLQLNVGEVTELPEEFTGLHLPAAALMKLNRRPEVRGWVGASVHSVEQAAHARELGLDYLVAGSLRETPSHPGAKPIGWSGFDAIVRAAGLPTYAIGGMTLADIPQVRVHWGQGIAAIRAFWPD